jgi:altronate dehydratase small subunit
MMEEIIAKDHANAIVISKADNVATAMVALRRGDVGRYLSEGGFVEILIAEAIPQYHKFALSDIGESELVLKYGEVIGRALSPIVKGSHVHVHNVISPGGKSG